jgi:hypothetical protein
VQELYRRSRNTALYYAITISQRDLICVKAQQKSVHRSTLSNSTTQFPAVWGAMPTWSPCESQRNWGKRTREWQNVLRHPCFSGGPFQVHAQALTIVWALCTFYGAVLWCSPDHARFRLCTLHNLTSARTSYFHFSLCDTKAHIVNTK